MSPAQPKMTQRQKADLQLHQEQAIHLLRLELSDQRKRLEGLAAQLASIQAERQDRDRTVWTRLRWLLGW